MPSKIRLSLILAAVASTFAAAPASAAIPPEVTLVPFITGVTRPVAMRDAGNGRYYIAQQDGFIRVFENGALLPAALLTLNATTTSCQMAPAATVVALGFTTPSGQGDERGLLGFELHPDFANNGFMFVHFSDARGDTAIVRYTVNGGTAVDTGSCRVVIRVDQDSSNHNGGDLHFGQDGFLYIGLGDGGGSNDQCNRALTLNPANLVNSGGACAVDSNFTSTGGGNGDSRALLGKFLRIDVNNTTAAGLPNELCADYADGSAGYAIPTPVGDPNPYTGNTGIAGACDETWSYGWRNPWRWSFDRTTGDLLVGDVGQGSTEEVDLEAASAAGGGNYGWRGCEGTSAVNGGTCAGTLPPILTYSHSNGCSIAGGYRYRGDYAGIAGRYFYGDSCTGEISVGTQGTPWSSELWLDASSQPGSYSLVSFAEDNAGRVFAIDHGSASAGLGRILLISTPLAMFANGFE